MTAAPRPGSMRDRAQGGSSPQQRESGFRQAPYRATSAPAHKAPYDPTRAPAGYDQDYWGMAVLFRDLAMKDVNLRAGVPVIYGELRRIFEWFDLEHGSRPFQKRGDGFVEIKFGGMYRDGAGKRLTWVQVGYAIIREFWSRNWDDDALAYFTDKEIFERIAARVVERWLTERQRAKLAARPQQEIQPMTWNREGHRRRRITSE